MMTRTIGRYEIRGELASGAQSVVYRAWDPRLSREVAIKTLHYLRSDMELNQLLLVESRLASQVSHPNTVQIYDAGEHKGDPYLVFELIKGRSLNQLLRIEGPLNSAHAAMLMYKVLDALIHLHELGIIHRDIKPSNILIDARGEPRVADFGSAICTIECAVENNEDWVGTPAYMAPECLLQHEFSAQSDLYAAGLVLIEMLTGNRYFQSASSLNFRGHFLKDSLRLPGGIGLRLTRIISKACANDLMQRYATAMLMRDAVEDFLANVATAKSTHRQIARLWTGLGAVRNRTASN